MEPINLLQLVHVMQVVLLELLMEEGIIIQATKGVLVQFFHLMPPVLFLSVVTTVRRMLQ